LYGILNGIDYEDYNPATDPGLARNFTADTIGEKEVNKTAVQKYFGLPHDPSVPLIGMVSRITEQKGFDLLLDIADVLLRQDVQLVILGGGDPRYETALRKLCKKHPKRAGCHLEFDTNIETLVYAGTDMLLMPSHYEPSGLGQMIALRYGSVPIVRATGGLADSISNYNPRTRKGNGFVFRGYDSRELLVAIARAAETYRYSDRWQALVQRSMRESFSWDLPASKYVTLFRKVLRSA
jgi:starch synthase